MSGIQKRERFHTKLKCGRCGAEGRALWEENSEMSPRGPMGTLVNISGNFIQRAPHNAQGQPVIACASCGAVHPD